jgi:Na+-translocating ferredoxin:NAD+ oxidoreductase subunit G
MTTLREPTAPEMAIRTAMVLFVFVVVFTGVLAGAYQWTRPSILASAAEGKMRLIAEVLPADRYDNELLKDTLSLPPTPELGLSEPTTVYRARKGGQPAAVVIEAVAPDGYSGRIRLVLAVQADGAVSGVRVIAHKETPGLGDYIEPKKDRKRARPWITQFEARSLSNPSERGWKVKKDGGEFDANAGATVTARAIVKAVKGALSYVSAQRDALYAISSTGAKP